MNKAIREVIEAYTEKMVLESDGEYEAAKAQAKRASAELAAVEKVLADIKTNCQQVLDMSHASEKNAVAVALADFIISLVESVK